MTAIKIESQEHWHQLRLEHIGGSEIASLFNETESLNYEDTFLTKFELFTYKSKRLPVPELDCDRVFWGNVIEASIGKGVELKMGWKVEKCLDYYVNDNCPGMGCTPDFLITDKNGRKGILQTKNTDRLIYMGWEDGKPPMKYILQVQHEIACVDVQWGVLGCLVGGNELKLFEYDRHTGAIAKIESSVKQFWIDVEAGKEPKVTGDDIGILKQLYPNASTESIDLTGDNKLPELCARALKYAEQRKEAEKAEKAAKAEILLKMGNAGYGICQGFGIKRSEIHKKEYTVKPSSYVTLTIKEK